ncbi:LuxR family transcriptional regulator [Streptomyces sp. PT12]|uniref:helix-turn-helix transcriptional regulator n=1 Tax=Streptomyces sp. PT12 TaxID=1510197 RepID=UPI000DE53AE9|nr:LuxR family transcriptional regulator [Streptomyces sp. PT12]RBM15533.1 LuxR family transcriptional regulator [Streptomyces sp. PT12]
MSTFMLAGANSAVRIDEPSLIERDEELRVLAGTLDDLRTGSGGFVLVEGPFGTGKSALLHILRQGAEAAGFTVLQARGSAFETGHPNGLVRQILEHWLASAAPPQGRGPADPATLLTPLLDSPEALDKPGGPSWGIPDPERQEREHDRLLRLLADLADTRPLVLLLDDLHLADSASMRFLGRLGGLIAQHPVLCCATAPPPARSGPRLGLDELPVQTLLAPAAPRSLVLDPLSEDGVCALLASAVPGQLSATSVRACYEATVGNPFFLRELVGELGGGLADPARISAAGPRTVARRILRRVHHLPRRGVNGALAATNALAVLDVADSVEQLATVADLNPAEAAHAVVALRAAGVVDWAEPPRFAAPIARNAVYTHMAHAFRYRAHYAAAQVLTDQGAPPQRIATHLLHVPPSTDGRAVETLVAAGRAALGEGDPARALSLVRRAARENVPSRTLPRLLAVLGEAEHRTGHPQAVHHLRDAISLTPEPAERARVALQLGAALTVAARHEEAAEVYRRAHAELGGEHPKLAARLCAAHSRLDHLGATGRGSVPELVRELGATSRATIGERTPDDAHSLALGAARALLSGAPGHRVIQLVDQALTHDHVIRHSEDDTRVPWFLAYCLYSCDKLAEAGTILDDAIQQAVSAGVDSRGLRALRAHVNLHRGMLSEAKNDASASLEQCTAGEADALGRSFAVLALTDLLILRNQPDMAARVFEEHGGWHDPGTSRLGDIALLIGRRHLHAVRGDSEAGMRDGERILSLLRETGSTTPALTPLPSMVENLVSLGQLDRAQALAAEHLADARSFGTHRIVARALYAYARTRGGDDAIEPLEEAVELLDGSPAIVDRCACLLQLGAVLRDTRRTAQARRRLREADEVAETIGATAFSGATRRALAALGGRTRDTGRPHTWGLTPREHRVSVLAAEGKRNHEIASILFVTVKTVEWHLSQVYRKLHIDSRSELSRVLSLG